MSTKLFFRTAVAALLLSLCAVAASAQSQPVTGKVTLKQADGSEAPVPNALVDFYQTDIARKFLGIKTDKKGEFRHAGLPFGTYTITVSAPNARPAFLTGVRISQRPEIPFALEPGDGKRMTLEEIKASSAGGDIGSTAAAAAAPRTESKDEKAKRDEMERERLKIEESNKKITNSNEVVARTFKAGNEALTARRYDEAITQYSEGVAARPDEPALLANMSEALRQRGVERYNAGLKSKDDASLAAAKKDWTDAADASLKALEALKTQAAASDPSAQANQAQNKLAAIATRALAMRFVATKVDASQASAALAAYQDYINAELDPAKKAKLKSDSAQMLLDAGAPDQAIAESQKILAENPDNTDANRIMGLALFASGDKGKYQDAANYLQRFVDKAPDTDPLKPSAKEALDYLKTAENVKPQKVTPARPASGRRRP